MQVPAMAHLSKELVAPLPWKGGDLPLHSQVASYTKSSWRLNAS